VTGFVGRALPRREDERLVRGAGRFLDDIDLPGLAHIAFVRSPYAHARLTAIRGPAAVTASSLHTRPLPIQPVEGAVLADAPHPLLAADEVRYAGQAVAAVVGDSPALAADLVEQVEVDYEPLPPTVDPKWPLEWPPMSHPNDSSEGPPTSHPNDSSEGRATSHPNDSSEWLMRWRGGGGVADAFAAAAHVVRTSHAIPRLVAAPIEPRGAIAQWHHDRLTLWTSSQDPHRPRAGLAHVLDLDLDAIHVLVPDVGGAFGSKGPLSPEAAVVAVLARQLGRPVKWVEDRSENFLSAYQGRGIQAEVELAFDASGRMLALRARILADLGAYLMPATGIPPRTMATLMTGCYGIEQADVEVLGARTNKVPTGPYRGAGRPEAAFVLERTVDAAARELGIDPVDLRRRNLIREFPHETPLGFSYDSGDYERCLDLALELVEPAHDPSRLVGTGVALYVERAAGQWESAKIGIEEGGIVVSSSASPHGQGHDITFAQVAADRLGVSPDHITVRFGDAPGVGTFGSRSTAVAGSAIALAADDLLQRGHSLAEQRLQSDVTWDGGRFVAADGRSIPLGDLAGLEASARFSSELVFASGAYAAVVEIERATGRLTVHRIAAVDDAGRIVNPLLAEGQVVGGAIQGLGAVLTEELVFDEEGQPRNASFMEYVMLTAAEAPELRTAFVESPSPHNPLGAKGIGEGGTIGTPAAIANAVTDALGGLHLDPPFTPEKLWRALNRAEPESR
jgi:carbon-monoxide dehydrogenase large subunit